jgi:Fe-S-cluster containining protein
MVRPLPLRRPFDRQRTSPFGYACGGCNRCCHGKVIPLNPYEVARIAAHLGVSTTEVLARFTRDCGASLLSHEDGSCVFLAANGCSIHPSRPLACRVYPLGRHVAADGRETFAEVEPHPETEGDYAQPGTVADYLRTQGAEPYIAASDRYLALFRVMLRALARRDDVAEACEDATRAVRTTPAEADAGMLDVDAVVARFCQERGLPIPEDVEERVALHIEALEAMLDDRS